MIGGDWELEDEGHYKESCNNNIITCELDNAKILREENERLGTIFRVKINQSTRTATLISRVGETYAKDITQ